MRRRTSSALIAVLSLLLSGLAALSAPAAHAATQCSVTYTKSDWGSGFTASVTIKNLGDALTSWKLTYAYTGNQTLTNGWSGNWSQSGKNITVTNASWNGSLATNASVSLGANFSYSGTNTDPTAFAINGTSCTGAHTAPTVTLTSPTAGAAYSAGQAIPLTATATTFDSATITKIEFYDDAGLIGTATSSPYTYSWTGATAGSYSIYAKVYDSLGGTGTSAPVGITVTSSPSVIVSPTTLSLAQSSTGTVAVKLSSQPTANVTVTATTSGNTGVTVSAGASLTFTTSNWSTAQNVTLSANATGTGNTTLTLAATGYTSATATITEVGASGVYAARFLTQYNKIMDSANGYFSPQGIPYHSVETLIVEAPDYGHETTSEAYSYLIWLQAEYGQATKNWTPFNNAWALMEKYMIPQHADQPTNSFYNASSPATYAPEHPLPSDYPSALDSSVKAGQDPIAAELSAAYGTSDIYGMHWLEDVDNKYGYGDTPGGGCELGPTASGPSYINTFQRGSQESVWETVPQPTCDAMKYGGTNGYLDLFIKDSSYSKQWKYTDAPDADARAIQAAYWADTWAKAQGNGSAVSATVAKAGKMGDYLRYSFFDKYFKKIGNCYPAASCAAGTGKDSEHYLLSWYYAWGGATDTNAGWAWRIGDGASHFGYQNPLAAYALINDSSMKPLGSTAISDWTTSLSRQIEFYQWLQSNEGAIAGGATNSWGGDYEQPPAGLPTFYGMAYDWEPVYHDPPSNQWFGMQAWSMERVAEYYYVTGDAKAKALLDKWVAWVLPNVTYSATGFSIPSTLNWTGQPSGNWAGGTGSPAANPNLHVTIAASSNDVGVAAALAKALSYYAAKSGSTTAKATAKGLLDAMWNNDQDSKGVAVPETRTDYSRFADPVYIPSGWTGKMPNGDPINSSSTFTSIRSWYTSDSGYGQVKSYLAGGPVPTYTYHRFWAQADIAMAMADYGRLFNE